MVRGRVIMSINGATAGMSAGVTLRVIRIFMVEIARDTDTIAEGDIGLRGASGVCHSAACRSRYWGSPMTAICWMIGSTLALFHTS